jgi:DNA recombination protein RmuC
LFIIASIGVFIGKLIFLLVFAPKNKPRKKLIAFSSQFNQLKEQLLNDKTIFEKQLENYEEEDDMAKGG